MRATPLDATAPIVLVVEDDEDLAFMYRFRFEHDGFGVAHAANGVQALAVARHLVPAAICLDMYIPMLDGLTVLKELKADPALRAIPVLVLSGLSEPELERQAMELGAAGVVVKAERSPTEVSAMLRTFIRDRELAQP